MSKAKESVGWVRTGEQVRVQGVVQLLKKMVHLAAHLFSCEYKMWPCRKYPPATPGAACIGEIYSLEFYDIQKAHPPA